MLSQNKIIFERITALALQAEQNNRWEEALQFTTAAAAFAWDHHPGCFVCPEIESLLLRLGQQLSDLASPPSVFLSHSAEKTRSILHVASTTYEIGGHTRLIANWIRNDTGSTHHLVITRAGGIAVPEFLAAEVRNSGGQIVLLPTENGLQATAQSLRSLAATGVDLIVLHLHPDDPVPAVAFAKTKTPVALMNSADHCFWLGGAVADAVIDFRREGRLLSQRRRGVSEKRSLLLPIPLSPLSSPLSKAEARKRLQIPVEQMMLFTMGTAWKLQPNEKYSLFETLGKYLDLNPLAHLYVVGVAPKDLEQWRVVAHERIHPLGYLKDPSLYEISADFVLQSFPTTSATAILESVIRGAYPVPAFGVGSLVPTILLDEMTDEGFDFPSKDEPSYLQNLVELEKRRLADSLGIQEIQSRVLDNHAGPGWWKRVTEVYQTLVGTRHEPEIPKVDAVDEPYDYYWAQLGENKQSQSKLLNTLLSHQLILGLSPRALLLLYRLVSEAGDCVPFDAQHWAYFVGAARDRAGEPYVPEPELVGYWHLCERVLQLSHEVKGLEAGRAEAMDWISKLEKRNEDYVSLLNRRSFKLAQSLSDGAARFSQLKNLVRKPPQG